MEQILQVFQYMADPDERLLDIFIYSLCKDSKVYGSAFNYGLEDFRENRIIWGRKRQSILYNFENDILKLCRERDHQPIRLNNPVHNIFALSYNNFISLCEIITRLHFHEFAKPLKNELPADIKYFIYQTDEPSLDIKLEKKRN